MPQTLQIRYTTLTCALIAAAGVAQFVACILWAVEHYPGGYRWEQHFVSDLGRTTTIMGLDNTQISALFARATLVLGLSLLPFLLVLPSLFTYGKLPLRILGILTAAGLIGIGQTPYDRCVDLHHLALSLWIVPMAMMVVLLPIVLRMEAAAPAALVALSLLLLLATLLYGLAGFRSGYVVMQKVVVALAILWFLVVAASVSIAAKLTPSDRQRLLAKQADWYAKRLRRRS